MNPSIVVKAAWDPEAKVFYIAYSDLLGLNVEAKTIDELREVLPIAIQGLTGRQVPFDLVEPDSGSQPVNLRHTTNKSLLKAGLSEAF